MLKTTTPLVNYVAIFPHYFLKSQSQDHVFIATVNSFSSETPCFPSLSCSLSKLRKIPATRKHHQEELTSELTEDENEVVLSKSSDERFGLLQAIPHVTIASMSNFLFGYHIGVMNGPIVSIAKELGFDGNSFLEGLVVSIFIGGAFIGSISAGSIVDKLGCRRTFQVDTIPLILGAIISAQAHSLHEILLGRFLVGLGIGVNNVLVPIYVSEVAPTKHRGSLGTVSQIGTCLGIIASLSLAISSESDPHWWRTMLYIASVPGFILFFGMQFAVESPRWLCKAGRLDEAANVVKNIWGPSEVDKAVEEFQSVLKNDGADLDSSWSELLEEPHSRVAFIGGTLFLLQQFAGVNGVLYFSSLTFMDVGITSSALASLYIGLMYFAGALFASYLIEKQGRQTLLIGSYLGMAISMFMVATVVSLPVEKEIGVNLTILGTIMYIIFFAFGAGPVTGLIIPELSSSRIRGKVMGFSMSVHWMFTVIKTWILENARVNARRWKSIPTSLRFWKRWSQYQRQWKLISTSVTLTFLLVSGVISEISIVCNFLVGLFFLQVVERIGIGSVYGGFGGVCLLTAAFAFYFTVETKGRSLEEIELSSYSNLHTKDD